MVYRPEVGVAAAVADAGVQQEGLSRCQSCQRIQRAMVQQEMLVEVAVVDTVGEIARSVVHSTPWGVDQGFCGNFDDDGDRGLAFLP